MSTPRALLKVGYACNNNCAFCHAAPHRGRDASSEELEQKIQAAAALGARCLVLTGGEVSIRSDFLALADMVFRAGMALGIVSNGRMLAYASLTEALIARGLDSLYLSLAGPDRQSHDRLVRAEAFEQCMKAMENSAGKIAELTLNVVVSRPILDRLSSFAELLDRVCPTRLKFSLLEPEGQALDDFEALVPGLQEACAAVAQATAVIRRRHPGLQVVADGFPRCLAPEGLEQQGLREDGFWWMSEAFEADWHPVDEAHRGFAAACDLCSWRRSCRGIFKTYLTRRGSDELRPRLLKVSNSFNLVPFGPIEELDPAKCSIRSGRRATPHPHRELWVEEQPGQARRFQVVGRDFSDASLLRAFGEDRLVLDESGGGLLENLSGQVRPMRLAEACRQCPKTDLCRGLWRLSDQAPFGRARRVLSEKLLQLSGRVLDVGCGSLPYAEQLRTALEQGRLDWLGIDPEPGVSCGPPGLRLLRSRLEDFEPDEAMLPFDAICLLRSSNHLGRPDLAMRRLCSWLKPGGRVLIADDACFGVLRSEADMQSLDSAAAPGFQHVLNLELDEARRWAAVEPLREVDVVDCRQSDSSLWILDLVREG